jgi:hypothetical protein
LPPIWALYWTKIASSITSVLGATFRLNTFGGLFLGATATA